MPCVHGEDQPCYLFWITWLMRLRQSCAKAQAIVGSLGKVDRCWTSPARQARGTAEALGLDATVDERLRDSDYGRWQGLKFQQVL